MKKLVISTSAFFVLCLTASAENWTLSGYLNEVFRTSSGIKQAEEDLELSKNGYLSSLAAFYVPAVTLSAANTPYSVYNDPRLVFAKDKTSAGTSVTYNLFNNFNDKRGLDSSRLSKTASEYRLWQEKQNATAESLRTYYNVLRAKRLMAVVKAGLKSYEEQYGKILEYYNEGMKSYSDVLKSELNFRSSQLSDASSAANYKNSVMDFNISLYREPESEAELEDAVDYSTASLPGLEGDLAYAAVNRIEIRLSENGLKTSESSRTSALIGYLPGFSVDASYNRQGIAGWGKPAAGAVNPVYSVGMSLSLPIGVGTLNARKNYISADIGRERARRNLRDLRLTIKREVISAYLSFSTTLKRYEVSKMKADISKQNLEIVTKKYGEGGAGIIELADAQNDDLSSQSDLANAAYDLLLSRADYDKAVGRQLWR